MLSELEIINQLQKLQQNKSRYFAKGLFPVYRNNSIFRLTFPDNNIFCSAAIAFILSTNKKQIDSTLHASIDDLITKVSHNYTRHQHKKNGITYSFWQQQPHAHFPNGLLFHCFKHFKLPDDVDTTAMVYLTAPPTLENCIRLKEKLPQHANGAQLWVKNSLPHLERLRCYSTWFGDKIPIELDVSVICNLMYWIFESKLPLNQYDNECIELIHCIIKNGDYFKNPFSISPEYPTPFLILFHISRVVAAFPMHFHADLISKLKVDLQIASKLKSNEVEKLMIYNSLLCFGLLVDEVDENKLFKNSFYWFTAGMISVYSSPILKRMAHWSIFHFRFRCEAFIYALLLENRALRKAIS